MTLILFSDGDGDDDVKGISATDLWHLYFSYDDDDDDDDGDDDTKGISVTYLWHVYFW